ncbi:MAG: hypothetical protein JSW23_11790 [Planctomycetota bacterium]|nr:MAG: hypothetical protein JSW23_11790 [Planctomycetota bacterium]
MATETNQNASGQTARSLHLNKPLVPIDEYAAREGLSRSLVEECGRLGIVQLRTYRGKTFVVNVPISPYVCLSAGGGEGAGPAEKNGRTEKISELMNRVACEKSISQEDGEGRTESGDGAEGGAISQLVRKMFDNASKVTERQRQELDEKVERVEPAFEPSQNNVPEAPQAIRQSGRSVNEDNQTRSTSRPVQTKTPRASKLRRATDKIRQARPLPPVQPPDMEIFELADEPAGIVDDTEPIYEAAQIPQEDGVQLDILTAQARAKSFWQTTAVVSLGLFFIVLVANIALFISRRVQLNRIEEAYATIQKLYDDTTQSSRQVESLQAELNNSSAQAGLFQNNLDNSKAELRTVRTELTQVRQDAETLRNELGKSRAENGNLRTQLGQYETELSGLQGQLQLSKEELKTVQDKLALATQELRTIRERNAEAAERLNRQIQKLTARLNELNKNSQRR